MTVSPGSTHIMNHLMIATAMKCIHIVEKGPLHKIVYTTQRHLYYWWAMTFLYGESRLLHLWWCSIYTFACVGHGRAQAKILSFGELCKPSRA